MINGVENLALAGAGIGAAIGAAGEVYSQYRLAREARSFTQVSGDLITPPTTMQRVGRAATSTLIIYGTFIGFFNGDAWANPPQQVKTVEPAIGVVVDHSGATLDGEVPAIEQIDSVIKGMVSTGIDLNVLVADSGEIKPVKPADVSSEEPFGDARLDLGLQTALNSVATQRTAVTDELPKSNALVVLTNGNGIGDVGVVTQRAKDIGTPVSIVNVESSVQDPAVQQQLQAVAEQTGGAYWNISSADGSEIAQEIAKELVDQQLPEKTHGDSPIKKIIGGLGIAGMGIAFWNRRHEPIRNGQRNIKENK